MKIVNYKTGIYVCEVLSLHLHANFEKNRFQNVGIIQILVTL